MGKRDQGRLVHEIRDALLAHGFQPTKVTQADPRLNVELTGIRQPGFTVQKHHDGLSARLAYRFASNSSRTMSGLVEVQALAEVYMRKLVAFNRPLEESGFICLEINSRHPLSPYSVWRRASVPKGKNKSTEIR
jgi:hypothetical protein